MFGWYQNCFYLCTRFSEVKYSGCSAVRLARQLRELEVAGSNPVSPTRKKRIFDILFFRIDPNLPHDETTPYLFLPAVRHRAIRL